MSTARYLIKHGVTGKTVGYDTVKRNAITKSKAYTEKHGVQSYVCDTGNDNAQIHITKTTVVPETVVNATIKAAIAMDKAEKKQCVPGLSAAVAEVKANSIAQLCLAQSIGWFGLMERM